MAKHWRRQSLCWLDRHVAKLADQFTGAMDFVVFNARVHAQQLLTSFDDHGDLFQCTVSCTLADAIDGAFHLTCAACTAAIELATDIPKSSWQWTEIIALSMFGTRLNSV